MYLPPPWFVVMPPGLALYLALYLAPSWHGEMPPGHLALALQCGVLPHAMIVCRWCSSAACCSTCDVGRVQDELGFLGTWVVRCTFRLEHMSGTRLACETPRSDLVTRVVDAAVVLEVRVGDAVGVLEVERGARLQASRTVPRVVDAAVVLEVRVGVAVGVLEVERGARLQASRTVPLF